MAETSKIRQRLIESGFFAEHIEGKNVIDLGVGRFDTFDGADCLCRPEDEYKPILYKGWDKDDGDATLMQGVEADTYNLVYASHILEHLSDPITAIRNWLRICRLGGIIFISVPHRDLYERRKTLPSKWNGDHKFFILPYDSEPPHTFSLKGLINTAVGAHGVIESIEVRDTSTNHDKQAEHAHGEYSIEAVIRKI